MTGFSGGVADGNADISVDASKMQKLPLFRAVICNYFFVNVIINYLDVSARFLSCSHSPRLNLLQQAMGALLEPRNGKGSTAKGNKMTDKMKNSPQKRPYLKRMLMAVAALATVTCLFACDRSDRKVGPTEKTTIAYATMHYSLLAQVAQVKGYFQQEGLEVTQRLHSYGKLALDDMIAGKADFATVAETPIMFAILNGDDISILATIHKTNKDNAMVARKDKGILVPSDLKGRKIATTLGTTSEFFLEAFLAINGIARRDVELIDLRQEELPQALAEGKVDAVAVFNPFLITVRKQLGENGITFFSNNIYTQTFNIVSTKEFVKNNPSKVNKVLRALDRAEHFSEQNPEEALKIVADFCKQDVAATRQMLDGTFIELSLDQSLIFALEDESQWAIKGRLTSASKVPNYLDYIHFDGLKSVTPEAVKILK